MALDFRKIIVTVVGVGSIVAAYRGHFLQSRSAWYGSLSDSHP